MREKRDREAERMRKERSERRRERDAEELRKRENDQVGNQILGKDTVFSADKLEQKFKSPHFTTSSNQRSSRQDVFRVIQGVRLAQAILSLGLPFSTFFGHRRSVS